MGRVLVFAGTWGMHGAAALCTAAAFRSGVGLVRCALPASIYPMTGALEPRATYLPLPEECPGVLHLDALPLLQKAAMEADVIAVGPGLGQHPRTQEILRAWIPQIECPLVVDADALNAFPGEPGNLAAPGRKTVVTPHAGEMRRLNGAEIQLEDDPRRIAAIDLALRVGGVVVLKGRRSVITDGLQVHFNPTGNPGMATAGSGDVLTGCLAALLCVIDDPVEAARVATWAHGDAGDRVAELTTEIGLTAVDLLDELPAALSALRSDDTPPESRPGWLGDDPAAED